MLSLVYLSSATRPFSQPELDALLDKSRTNNTRDDISGILVYRDGDFLQVLEGPEDKVRAAFARINRDDRHNRVMVLDESNIDERAFGDWSMGFRRVKRGEPQDGFVDFFGAGFDEATARARGKDVYQYLLSFRSIGG